MKKLILIAAILLISGFVIKGIFKRPKPEVTIKNTPAITSQNSIEVGSSSKSAEKATSNPNENIADATGRSYYDKPANASPKVDVAESFNVGSSGDIYKTVEARFGQRVGMTFSGSLDDQVVIDGYNIDTYTDNPLTERAVKFTADKKGEFRIRLVKSKKDIGVLKVN